MTNANRTQKIAVVRLAAVAVVLMLTFGIAQVHAQEDVQGPGRGGGGDRPPSEFATEGHIVTGVYNGVRLLKYGLHSLEREYFELTQRRQKYGSVQPNERTESLDLIFTAAGGDDPIKALLGLQFDIRENGDCVDPKNKERRDSSFDPSENKVCVSIEKILEADPKRNRLTVAEAQEQIVILLGHELAHRMGADEGQAKKFEDLMAYETKFAGARAFDLRIKQIQFENELRTVERNAEDLYYMAKYYIPKLYPFPEACRFVDALGRTAVIWSSSGRDRFYQELDNPTQGRLLALAGYLQNLSGYCRRPDMPSPERSSFPELAFYGSGKSSTVEKLVEIGYGGLLGPMIPVDFPVFERPTYASTSGLAKAVARIYRQLSLIRAGMQRDEDQLKKARAPIYDWANRESFAAMPLW